MQKCADYWPYPEKFMSLWGGASEAITGQVRPRQTLKGKCCFSQV